jgi:hypothetical protein
MSQGGYRVLTVISLVALGCVELTRPPELLNGVDGGVRTNTPSGDAGVDAPSPVTTEEIDAAADGVPSSDRPAESIGERGDAPGADVVTADQAESGPAPSDAGMDVQEAGVDSGVVDGQDSGLQDASDGGNPSDGGEGGVVGPIVVDDFQDADLLRNSLAAEVITENQSVSRMGGELTFVATRAATGISQSFAENLKPGGCPVDLRAYRTLSFRMRASAANKTVYLVMGRADGACNAEPILEIGMVTVGTTAMVHNVDLAPFARESARFFQWVTGADNTRYFLDDILLVP